MTDCQHCATDSAIYDLNRLCCAARFIASLPTSAAMARSARSIHASHGHSIEDLRRNVRAIQRRRLEVHLATVANR